MSKPYLSELENALQNFWSRETCHPNLQKKWTFDNPAFGQGSVTALTVFAYYGGRLAYNKQHNHCWNILPSESQVDLAKSQFPEDCEITLDEVIYPGEVIARKPIGGVNFIQRQFSLQKSVDSFLEINFSYYFMGKGRSRSILKKKHTILHDGKGDQINLFYAFFSGETGKYHNRIITMIPSGLYTSVGEDAYLTSFSEQYLDTSVHITSNQKIANELFDRISGLNLGSKGKELFMTLDQFKMQNFK